MGSFDKALDDAAQVELSLRLALDILNKEKIMYCIETKQFYRYAEGVYKPIHEEDVHGMIIEQFGGKKRKVSTRANAVKNIAVLSRVGVDQIRTDMVNFKNGLLDINKNTFREHTPEVKSTIQLPYEYDKDADCPLWKEKLAEIFEDDLNKVNLLQEYFGYCLTRETKYEKALFMIGRGANGKSVVCHTLMHVVGNENCSAVPLGDLSKPENCGMLIDKLVNIDTEVMRNSNSYEKVFKAIASGDQITINEKYVKKFKYTPFCKLVYALNEMPRINDSSDAFWRRMLILEFNRSFDEKNRDVDLKEKLLTELPGILNWSLVGLKRLRERKHFLMDAYMQKRIKDMRRENNPIMLFVDENISFTDGEHTSKTEMYDKYKKWCLDNGCRQLGYIQFNRRFFDEYGDKTERDARLPNSLGKERIWPNVHIKTEWEKEENEDHKPTKDRPY